MRSERQNSKQLLSFYRRNSNEKKPNKKIFRSPEWESTSQPSLHPDLNHIKTLVKISSVFFVFLIKTSRKISFIHTYERRHLYNFPVYFPQLFLTLSLLNILFQYSRLIPAGLAAYKRLREVARCNKLYYMK